MKEPMAHVQIIGLKDRLQPAVHALHELGCLHVEDMASAGVLAARPFSLPPALIAQRDARARLLAQIEGQITALGDGPEAPAATFDGDCLAAAQLGTDELAPQLARLATQTEALAAESATLPRYIATLRQLLPVIPAAAETPGHVFSAVLVGRRHAWVLAELGQTLLEHSAGRAELANAVLSGERHALVVVLPQSDAHLLESLLGREDIARLQLPADVQHLSPAGALAALQERQQRIPEQQAQLAAARAELAPQWLPRLYAWRHCLHNSLAELEILGQFGETNQTFAVTGWLPARDLPRLRAALDERVGGGILVEELPPGAAERQRAPVLLRNPAPARPFQSLVRLLSLPSYDGLDPTILMAIGLPILFGIILGDIGYGALLLLLALVGRRRLPAGTLRDIANVLLLGAGWSIVFGFLYGELFGTLGEHLGLQAIWLDRADPAALFALFVFTIATGVTHITLGLIIGIWDAWRARQRHHLLERGGMLVGLIGLFLIVAVLVDWLPAGVMNPAIAVLILGIVLLSSATGWLGLLIGPIEFIGLIGNILSYLRLAAVGLASVYVARLANDLVGSTGSLIIGIIVAVLIHALNLVLGAFSPTIHSLRLHYVEFFRKFYEGGGQPYAPFQIE